jgi:hypothetical protein
MRVNKNFNCSFLRKVIVERNSYVLCEDVGVQMIESVVGKQNYIFSEEKLLSVIYKYNVSFQTYVFAHVDKHVCGLLFISLLFSFYT